MTQKDLIESVLNDESIGLIAQEVAEVIPELTFVNDNDGYMGIHYDLLSAILVKGIQQLKINYDSKIKELEEKIEILSKRFDYL